MCVLAPSLVLVWLWQRWYRCGLRAGLPVESCREGGAAELIVSTLGVEEAVYDDECGSGDVCCTDVPG